MIVVWDLDDKFHGMTDEKNTSCEITIFVLFIPCKGFQTLSLSRGAVYNLTIWINSFVICCKVWIFTEDEVVEEIAILTSFLRKWYRRRKKSASSSRKYYWIAYGIIITPHTSTSTWQHISKVTKEIHYTKPSKVSKISYYNRQPHFYWNNLAATNCISNDNKIVPQTDSKI